MLTLSDDYASTAIIWNKDRYVVAYGKRPETPGDAIWGTTVDEDGTILIQDKKLTSGAKLRAYAVALAARAIACSCSGPTTTTATTSSTAR